MRCARRTTRLLALLAAAVALAAAAGCGTRFARGPVVPRRAPGQAARLGPGDVIAVEAWGDPTLARRVTLGPDGAATLPLVGPAPLRGLTLEEAEAEVARRLAPLVRDSRVRIGIVEPRSLRFEVFGEVYEPGSFVWYEGDTVVTALERAGGFVPHTAAFWNVHLVRGATDRPKVWRVDVERVLEARAEDVPIEPGDWVYVPPRWATSLDRFVLQAAAPVTALFGFGREIDSIADPAATVTIPVPAPGDAPAGDDPFVPPLPTTDPGPFVPPLPGGEGERGG